MSLVSKDTIIKACADAYKEGTGETSVKVGDLAGKILSAIVAGGSGGSSLPEGWAIGQFNTTNETMAGDFTVEHGLGAMPNVVVIFKESKDIIRQSVRAVIKLNTNEDYDEEYGYYPGVSALRTFYDNNMGTGIANAVGTTSVDDNRETFTIPKVTNAYYMPHLTYQWIAIALGG